MTLQLGYCTVQDVANMLPGIKIGLTSDITTEAVETLIESRASKIIAQRNQRRRGSSGYQFPDLDISTPTTNRQLILFLLNLEEPVARILLRRTGELSPAAQIIADQFIQSADYMFNRYLTNEFDYAFLNVLTTTPITTIDKASKVIPGLVLSSTSRPTDTTVQKLVNAETAVLYALTALKGYNKRATTPYTPQTQPQISLMERLILKRCYSHLLRIRAETTAAVLNVQANLASQDAEEDLSKFANSVYTSTFTN